MGSVLPASVRADHHLAGVEAAACQCPL